MFCRLRVVVITNNVALIKLNTYGGLVNRLVFLGFCAILNLKAISE